MNRSTVGFAGMTHLGLISAVATAERGFNVIGFDAASARIESLARRELSIVEPGLPELMTGNAARLTFTDQLNDLRRCEIVYVSADIPTDDHGQSDLAGVRALIARVEAAIDPATVLVISSQVPPGFTRRLSHPPARRFCQVETLIIGRAVERALHPQRFIVGCADATAVLPTPLLDLLGSFGCPIFPMRYESAELAKLAINVLLVASLSAANMLAELCERVGGDWSDIMPPLTLDPRIGQDAYVAPGLGIAGGNLERDLSTVCQLADAHGTDAGVARAFIASSRHRRDWALMQIHERVLAHVPDPVLAVLGLAYKQDTNSTKNSPSLALLAALKPFVIQVFDPVVPARPEFHPRLVGAGSALEACRGADALMIMTPWPEFRRLAPASIVERLRGRTVIDPYAVLSATDCHAAGLDHFRLGTAVIRDGT